MPQVQEVKVRTLCPTGIQEFVLADVTPKMLPRFNGEGENERWIWRFVGNKQDPETGEYYEVAIFTGIAYGDSRARLTWLLDLLLPNATTEQKRRLDTDTLLGSHYEGMVKHEAGVKDPSQKFATFAYLRPVGDNGGFGFNDPFAFDQDGAVQVCAECGEEVDDNIAKHALKRWGIVLCHKHGRARMAKEKVDAANAEAAAV